MPIAGRRRHRLHGANLAGVAIAMATLRWRVASDAGERFAAKGMTGWEPDPSPRVGEGAMLLGATTAAISSRGTSSPARTATAPSRSRDPTFVTAPHLEPRRSPLSRFGLAPPAVLLFGSRSLLAI